MIKNMLLENFGRFRRKAFSFAPVTLFSGNNETGKTTLFDALFDTISKPKGNTEQTKYLVKRYGKDRQIVPEYNGEPFSINENDFLNLFAIRSGSISLKIEQNSQWMNQVKASLFSGGIDPGTIVLELDNVLRSRKQGTIGGEAKTLAAELENLEAEKAKTEATRQKCFEDEKRIANTENHMVQLREEISQLETKQRELEKTIKQQNLLREEKSLKEILSNTSEKRRKRDEQEKYSRFDPAMLENMRKLEAEARHHRTEAEKASVLEEETRRARTVSLEEKDKYEAEKSRGDSRRILADHLRDALVPREKLVRTKIFLVWRKPILAAAAILLISGGLVFFLTAYSWIVLTAAIGAACICAAIAPTRQIREDTSALDDSVKAASEKWKKETGEDLGLNYEELLAALERAAEKSRAALENYDRAATGAAELERKANDFALQKKLANDNADTAERQLRSKLDETGTADISGYIACLETKRSILERCKELDEKLKNALADHDAASADELEDIISRKIAEISRNITEAELSAGELRTRDNLLFEVKTNLDVLRREEMENTGTFNKDLGTILGQLSGLPEKIADCEKGIKEKKERLDEINRELRAVKIAQELFASIAEDSGLMLEKLSGEIGELFSTITEAGRKVSMENFSMENVSVADALGSGRDSNSLSTGTRDAFLLAARLTLARKSTDSNAIIVLDEPFLALDRPRTGRALSILKKFHEATLWQLVLFTKDEETVNQAREIFGSDLCVHELEQLSL